MSLVSCYHPPRHTVRDPYPRSAGFDTDRAQDGVISSAFGSRRPTLVRITCTGCPLQNGRCWLPSRSILGKRTRAPINRDSYHSRERMEFSPRANKDGATPLQAHHHKNTPREAVLPLYYSSSAQEAIHHTTHRSRVLHHNNGPNLYKSCVSCVVHHASLESRQRFGACIGRE